MVQQVDTIETETAVLERLNEEYVASYMSADVAWYEEHLASDFVCIESDGSVLDKTQFLKNTARGPDVADYKLQKVNVRIYGNVALIQATGLWTTRDGTKGVSRYIDVYVQTSEAWKAVSAQITRTTRPDALNDK